MKSTMIIQFRKRMYRRTTTLIEHQPLACDALGFQRLTGYHGRCPRAGCARNFTAQTTAGGCAGDSALS
jgi:hypothetical protein